MIRIQVCYLRKELSLSVEGILQISAARMSIKPAFILLNNLLIRCIGIRRPKQMNGKPLIRIIGISRLRKAGSFYLRLPPGGDGGEWILLQNEVHTFRPLSRVRTTPLAFFNAVTIVPVECRAVFGLPSFVQRMSMLEACCQRALAGRCSFPASLSFQSGMDCTSSCH